MKHPLFTLLVASGAFVATVAQAAEITWSVHNITGNESEVSNAGTTVVAASGADGGTNANVVDNVTVATVNGVVFTDAFTMDSPSHLDTLGTRANAGVSGAYYDMLKFADRQGSGLATWTFNGLTIGNTYQIQIWAQDKNAVAGVVGHVLNNGGINTPILNSSGHALILIEASGEGSAGQYALGTFVADGATQQFQARAYTNLTTTPATASNITINAYQLRDLGFQGPDLTAPAPDPMTWASVPAAAGDSSITMTATTATDDNGVEYQFKRYASDGTTLLFTSPWQDEATFTDTGLTADTQYTYTVTTRDKSPNHNETAASAPASATTDAPDTTKPTPDPMTFAVAPAASGAFSITMTAATATDDSGVEYFFDETSNNPGGSDSGWQDSPSYTDTGLAPNTQYTYTVTARDKATVPNTTEPSTAASATTEDIDNIAPTPDPMTFAVLPTPASSTAITMTATPANDTSGVEYFFDETSNNPGGSDSGWQDSPSYTDTGLTPNTQYTYTVIARDKGPLQNSTAASTAASATTHPTATITWAAHNITNSVSNVSRNGTLHEARAGANASQFVNGTVFESNAGDNNIFDSLFGNDSLTTRGYGSVVTALSYQTLLKFGQRSGRPDWNEPPRIASTQSWATVNFTGLTIGNLYEIQIWASDVGFSPDGVVQKNALVLGDGSPGAPVFGTDTQLFYEVADFGAGQYGTGTFVAVASTQSFNVQSYTNLDTTPSAKTFDHMANGLQIRDLGPSVSDYDQWAAAQDWTPGEPGTGANDDYDRDGLTNDSERVFGLDSTDPTSATPFTSMLDPASGSFNYTRRKQSMTGLDYKVFYSMDLTRWFEDSGAVQTPGTAQNDVEIVGVQVSEELLDEPRLFVQLAAQAPVTPTPAPRLASLWGSGTTITLNFTEEMDASAAGVTDNYTVELDGGGAVTVTDASLGGDGRTVTLTLGASLGTGSAYNVATSNLTGSEGAALAGNATARFVQWDNDPNGIKVFILAGQSNMVGYGYSEEGGNPAWTPENGEPKTQMGGPGSLRYLARNNGVYPEYDYTALLVNPSDTDSAWKNRPDVKVWWEQGVSGNLNGAEGFGDLGPPFRGGSTAWFGPEYGFGQVIGDFYSGANEAPVLIIKTAWGGHSLGGNFRPPSAVADRGGVVGASYDEMLANAQFILNNLAAKFPAAQYPEFDAVDYRYQIVGFALHQGYTDRVSADISPEYQENLPDFIHDVRGAFGKPDMPFVIASTGMDTTFVEASPYPNYTEVEQAQLWVVGDAPPANVRSSDTRGFMESAVDSPRNQGFHWHGNARSYFRIGLALGDDMVDLLTP